VCSTRVAVVRDGLSAANLLLGRAGACPTRRAGCAAAGERHDAAMTALRLSQDPDADALLSEDPLALLLGMLLDQQMRE
jgi:hypothetical protein